MSENNSTSMQKDKLGSLGRLKNLLRKIQKNQKLFDSYDPIVQEQSTEGVVEKVND